MTVMPVQEVSPEVYRDRLLRRLTPVLIGALLIFAIMVVIAVFLMNVSALRLEYITTLNRAAAALETEVETFTSTARELAADLGLRNYVTGATDNIPVALERFTALIRNRPDDYQAIRFIDLQGRVQVEIINVQNVPLVTDPAILAAETNPHYDLNAFELITGSTRASIAIDTLHRSFDADGISDQLPRVELGFYVPVYNSTGVLIGALQVEANARDILSIVNLSGQTLLDLIPGRRLMLVQTPLNAENGLIIADSGSSDYAYLRDLEAVDGNAGDNPLYQQALSVVAERTGNITGELNGTRLVSSSRLTFPANWALVLSDDIFVAFSNVLLSLLLIAVVISVLSVGGILLMRWLVMPIITPVALAEARIRQLAHNETVPDRQTATGEPEFVKAVEQVAGRLNVLQTSLHEQVGRRNRDLQVAGRIGREIATLLDLDSLVPRAINLICNELGFYHAQVFLLDDTQTLAVLRYSRGEAGRQMIARGHKIRVGSSTVIGTVTGDRRAIIINDTLLAGEQGKHGFNPLLPETRAEMGLPLIIGDNLIGALDIQSREPGVFLIDDLPTFQLLADQLAIAIYHAQLKAQSDARIARIDQLNRQLTREAWESTEEKNRLSSTYGAAISLDAPRLVAPITIRGEIIGTLDAALPDGQEFTEGDKAVLNAVAGRVALAIENARLFQETQASLSETSVLYDLNRRLNEASTLEDILLAMLSAVAPDAAGGQVWLFEDRLPDTPPDRMELVAQVTARSQENAMPVGAILHMQQHTFLVSLRDDKIAIVNDVTETLVEDDWLREMFMMVAIRSVAFIPLNMRGLWKGLITLGFDRPRTFTDREKRLYTALIAQAGVAIDNRLLLRQTEDALSRNEKLYAASRIINTASTLEELVYAAVGTSSHYDVNFWLALLEGENDETGWPPYARRIARSTLEGDIQKDDYRFELIVPDHSAMRRREPDIFIDAELENDAISPQVHWMRAQGQRFMAIFPLFSDNQPIALFYIVSPNPQELTQEDYEVYKALTGQMSTQIQNRRLLEQTEAALSEARRLYVASSVVAAAQDTFAIYDALAGHLAMPFLQMRGNVVRMSLAVLLARPHPGLDAPYLEYAYEWFSETGVTPITSVKFVTQHEVAFGELLEDSETGFLVYHNLAKELRDYPAVLDILSEGDASGAVVVPLRSRQQWFGVMIVRSDNPLLFDDGYVRFAGAIAGQVAIAIERQQLLLETEQERANLNAILSTLPAGVLVLDPVTFVPQLNNDRVSELLQQDLDFTQPFTAERYNLYRTGTNLFYPNDELPIYTSQRQNRPMFSDDVAVILPDYQTDLLVNAAPIYDNRGEIRAIVVAIQDISNLRSLENTLQENLRETVSLYETQRSLSQAETLDELLDNILMQLAMQQPGNACIVLGDIETGEPHLARYLMQPLEPLVEFGEVLTDRVVISQDASTDYTFSAETRTLLLANGVRSLLVVPLLARTRSLPLGWLLLAAPEANAFTEDQERMVTTLGDMATTAVDNNYLVRSTQAALRETAALYNAATTISRAHDTLELSMALEEALIVLRPDMYAGFMMDGRGVTQELFKIGFEELEAKGALLSEIVHLKLTAEAGEFVEELTPKTPGELAVLMRQSDEIQAYAAVNLRIKDMPGGRLLVAYREPRRFSDGEKRFLSTVTDSASIVVDNQLLLEQLQGTLQETSVLYQASRALIEVDDPDDIVQVIVDYLIEPHINQVFILILSTQSWASSGAVVNVVSSWQSEDSVDLRGVTLNAEQFPAWSLLATETVLTINDIFDPQYGLNPLEQNSIESLDTRSVAIIPLRVANRALGAIWIGSREVGNFTHQTLRIYQAFAEQTSLSLEASRLLEQTNRRASQLETSAQISQRVGQILDLDILLPQVVELIKERFQYDHVQVFLMDDEQEWALLRASTGEAGVQLLGVRHKLRKGSDSVIGRVTSTQQPALALDTADANVVHKPNPYLPLTRSEMALPLLVKGEIVGALDVQSNQPNAFNEEDIQVLTTLAAQIAVAIENARLYKEAESRASEMSFLFDVITSAAAADKLEGALQTIADRLVTELGALSVVLYLPKIYEDYEGNSFTLMCPAAVAVAAGEQPIAELTNVRVNDLDNLIGVVSTTMEPLIVRDVTVERRYMPAMPSARAAIISPITSAQELVGLIAMESARIGDYDEDTLRLMLTLAQSLAAIIQNSLLVEKLQKTNDQLRELDRLKSQFLASMSHELRTPLNSIIGFSRVMLKGIDGPLTDMQEQDLNTIYNSGNHLLNLINDILDQAKIEANELNLKFGYFDVKPMVESVKSIAIGLMKDKPLALNVEISPGLPQAYGDESRSRQILLNLVSNAIKFTPQGTVGIRAYAVQDDKGATLIRVDVSDTGIGIDQKDMPILFEPFRQVDSSLTRTVGGTGLGLPISKSLSELQGGQLMVESQVGVGSVFSVLVPTMPGAENELKQKRDAQKSAAQQKATPSDTGVFSKSQSQTTAPPKPSPMMTQQMMPVLPTKREVLLIEDNKDMVDQYRRLLQREGYDVQVADHPSYARAMVSTMRPNIVLMDVNFGSGQGWSILKDLKEDDATFDIPIIVVTLSSDSEQAYRLGAHTFLQRPVMPDDLVSTVKKAEEESRRERILIIDDQPESIRLLKQLLGEHGNFRVFSAGSGAEGIGMVARRHPDLIILDLRMPEMDGFAVLNELRSNPETAKIPVMVVTGEVDFNSTEQEMLENVHILHKTNIGQEEYQRFIEQVKLHLNRTNGK